MKNQKENLKKELRNLRTPNQRFINSLRVYKTTIKHLIKIISVPFIKHIELVKI